MHRQLKQNMNKRDEQASQKKKEEDIQKANKHIKNYSTGKCKL